jgi:hypothetical protein
MTHPPNTPAAPKNFFDQYICHFDQYTYHLTSLLKSLTSDESDEVTILWRNCNRKTSDESDEVTIL